MIIWFKDKPTYFFQKRKLQAKEILYKFNSRLHSAKDEDTMGHYLVDALKDKLHFAYPFITTGC